MEQEDGAAGNAGENREMRCCSVLRGGPTNAFVCMYDVGRLHQEEDREEEKEEEERRL